MKNNKYEIFNNLLLDFKELKQKNNGLVKELLNDFPKIKEKTREIVKENSSDFNILKFFKISEPQHSKLLGDLLNPKGTHGQGNLFLILFLKKLVISNPEKGTWSVFVEKRNIDILLTRKNPQSVVIIENKSNWAEDQSNQLYRYWYQEMYLNKKEKKIHFWKEQNENYKIVYLPPSEQKYPSSNSISKPNHLDGSFPETIPLHIEIWGFNNQIIDWLENCLEEIPEKNYRLKEYIKQYIEFWN